MVRPVTAETAAAHQRDVEQSSRRGRRQPGQSVCFRSKQQSHPRCNHAGGECVFPPPPVVDQRRGRDSAPGEHARHDDHRHHCSGISGGQAGVHGDRTGCALNTALATGTICNVTVTFSPGILAAAGPVAGSHFGRDIQLRDVRYRYRSQGGLWPGIITRGSTSGQSLGRLVCFPAA